MSNLLLITTYKSKATTVGVARVDGDERHIHGLISVNQSPERDVDQPLWYIQSVESFPNISYPRENEDIVDAL